MRKENELGCTIKIIKNCDISYPGLVILFNNYRIFYNQIDEIEKCSVFLKERILNQESFLYVASYNDKAVGFVQLYPSFSSITMSKIHILNDLYVDKEYRGLGIGERLIKYAEKEAQRQEIEKILLKTSNDNPAKKLYNRLGYIEDKKFCHYLKII